MRRSALTLTEVADWHNLSLAFHRAAQGKNLRPEVARFRDDLHQELALLRQEILDGAVTVGVMRQFRIRDPKPRIIHAPSFRERVLHHALMAHAGPVLERGLVDDTFACRVGKGTLAAVMRCQQHQRHYPWYAQIDIRGYFPSIDHGIMYSLLARRFKNPGLLGLMERMIQAYHVVPGKGLPIGALTSQYFANEYLNGVDRLLLETCRVPGMVRYMDDLVWWGESRAEVRQALVRVRAYAGEALGLTLKEPVQIGRADGGLIFCGFRILPERILLSRRRKRRYIQARRRWEEAFLDGRIDAQSLQAGYATVLATTLHGEASGWRREQLCRHPLDPILSEL